MSNVSVRSEYVKDYIRWLRATGQTDLLAIIWCAAWCAGVGVIWLLR